MTGFCLGMGAENAPERERYRKRLSERVQEIVKRMLDACSVLNEEPPTTPAKTMAPKTPTKATPPEAPTKASPPKTSANPTSPKTPTMTAVHSTAGTEPTFTPSVSLRKK